MILLDTNICIAHLNGDPRVVQPIQNRASELAVPTLVAAELFYGFEKSARARQNIPLLKEFLQSLTMVGFDLATAEVAGHIWTVSVRKPVRVMRSSRPWRFAMMPLSPQTI